MADMTPTAEGTVKIRGMFKQWTSKYVIVRDGVLSVYKDAGKAEWGKAEAEIQLRGKCQVSKRNTKKGGFCFKVRNREGKSIAHGAAGYKVDNAIFRVPTHAMRDAWLEVIRSAINGDAFGTFFPPFVLHCVCFGVVSGVRVG